MHNEENLSPAWKRCWKKRLQLFLISLVGIQLLSCSLFKPPIQQGSLLTANAQELLALLQTRKEALQTLKGLFSAQIKGPGIPITQTIHGTIIFQDPHLLRIKGFTRFGGSLFDFSLGQNQYLLSLPRDGKVLSGSLEELRQDPEVEKPIILTVLAMSGVIGIETVATPDEVVLLEVEDQYLLEVNEPDRGHGAAMNPRRRIWFDRQTLYVVKEERMGHRGAIDASLQLDDFREAVPTVLVAQQNSGMGKLMMPFHLIAQDSTGEGEITVKFTELRPNVPVTGEDFSLRRSSMAK